jgi:hypothetical protein
MIKDVIMRHMAMLERNESRASAARVRTLYHSQKVIAAAMQIAEKKVWAQRS